MPQYQISVPGKGTFRVDSPTELTDLQAWQAVQSQLAAGPSKERTVGEAAKDIAASVVSGAGSLVQLPGQLYGLATGNFSDTGALGLGKDIQKYGEEMKSAGLKAREAERAEKIRTAEQKGQWEAFKTAFGETIKDPALLTSFLAEQAPQLLVPFGAAKVAQIGTAAKAATAAQGLTGAAAREAVEAVTKEAARRGTAAAVGAGAVQQGADVGSQAYEDIYKELISKGATEKDAAQGAINLARATGASGALISLLAQRLPGAKTLEESFAGVRGPGGRLVGAARGALGEGASEIVEETGGKFGANLAMREVKPEQSLLEGLGATAGMAAVGGVGLGGAAGLAQRPSPKIEIINGKKFIDGKPVEEEPTPEAPVAPEAPVKPMVDRVMEMAAQRNGYGLLEQQKQRLLTEPKTDDVKEELKFIQEIQDRMNIETAQRATPSGKSPFIVTPKTLTDLGISPTAPIIKRLDGKFFDDPVVVEQLEKFAANKNVDPEVQQNVLSLVEKLRQPEPPVEPAPVSEAPTVETAPPVTPAPVEPVAEAAAVEPSVAQDSELVTPTVETSAPPVEAAAPVVEAAAPPALESDQKALEEKRQMIADMIETKKANREPVPEAWIKRLADLSAQLRGETISEGETYSMEVAGHPLFDGPPVLRNLIPIKVKDSDAAQRALDRALDLEKQFATEFYGARHALSVAKTAAQKKAAQARIKKLNDQGWDEDALQTLRNETIQELSRLVDVTQKAAPKAEAPPQELKSLGKASGKQLQDFQQTLRNLLNKFGLKDVGLNIVEGMDDAGSYSQQLIRIAAEEANPIRTLRHEAIHALRELGFFTDAQWKSLSKMAKEKWVDQYLKQRNVQGRPLKAGEESRYDAYMREYNGDMEKITEEAVADAFADFDATKPPAGLIQALLKRMKDLFQSIKSALTKVESPEQIFGKVEKGELKPGEKRQSGERKSVSKKESDADRWAKHNPLEISNMAQFANWSGSKLVGDPITGKPVVFYVPSPRGFTGKLNPIEYPENGLYGVMAEPYKPKAEFLSKNDNSWMNQNEYASDDAMSVPAVIRGSKIVTYDELLGLREQYPNKTDAQIASIEDIAFVDMEKELGESTKIVLNPNNIVAAPKWMQMLIDEAGNKRVVKPTGPEIEIKGYDTFDVDSAIAQDIAFEMGNQEPAGEAKAASPDIRKSLSGKRSTQEVARIFGQMVKRAEKELSSALFNWNDSRLNEDKDKIVVYPGRDQRFVRGKEGGKSNVSKAEFIDWLMSDAPFDTSVYGEEITRDAEWKSEIETLRSIVETPDIRKSLGKATDPGQQALDLVNSMNMGIPQPEPGFFKRLTNILKGEEQMPDLNLKKAKEVAIKWSDQFEKNLFSADAPFQNALRRGVKKDLEQNAETVGLLVQTSIAQTVNIDNVVNKAIIDGGADYSEDMKKWHSVVKKDNMKVMAEKLQEIAQKYNKTSDEMKSIAHAYLVSKRLPGILKRNEELTENIKAEKATAKPDRKKIEEWQAQLVYVSDKQIAQMDKGLSLVNLIPELTQVSDILNGIRENFIDVAVKSGLWTREYAEAMLNNVDYVPYYRVEQLEENAGPLEFLRGLQVKAKEHKLKGSDSPVNDVFDNMVRWSSFLLNRSMRAHKAKQMIYAAKDIELGGRKMAVKVTEPKKGMNIVRVFNNGVQELWDVADPNFVDAFAATQNVSIPMFKAAAWVAEKLRNMIVLYPMFSVAQVPQDSVAAVFTSGLKPQFALKIPYLAVKEFVKTIAKTSATHNELAKFGVVGARDFSADVMRKDAEIEAGLKSQKGPWEKTKEILEHIAMAGDNAVRQATYIAARQQGVSEMEALEKSFEIFNVRRRGTSKALNLAGQTIPFFYAYLAAQRVAYKTITGVGTSPTTRKAALETLAYTTAAVMTLSMLYAMMVADDEDYAETPAAVRDRTITIPGTGGVRIPLRPDFFLFPKIVAEHTYLMLTDRGYEDGAKFRTSMKDALFNAVTSPTVIPQIVKPALEVGINYSFFEGRPVVGQFEKEKALERQFNDSTSELSKLLGQTGLVSPIAADHLIRGMLGSVGGLILFGSNFFSSDPDVPRPELSWGEVAAALPGTSGFLKRPQESALKNDFFLLRDEVEKAVNTFNDIKTRSPQGMQDFLDNEKMMARYMLGKPVDQINRQLSKIRRQMTVITNMPESQMSAEDKADNIRQLREYEREYLKSVDVKALREMAKI